MHSVRRLAATCLSALVALTGAFLSPVLTAAPAAADTEGDWQYTVNTSPVVSYITGYTGPGGAVTTPATLGGNPVVTIEEGTFAGRTDVTSVTVTGPNVVSVTGFANSGVTDVVLPEGVTTIGSDAFASTPLSSVTIPSTVTNIGVRAFSYTPMLTSVDLPTGLQVIQPEAFSDSGLASVVIPDSVTLLQSGAFHNDPLTNITIGSGITTIEPDTFSGTTGLTSVTIPDNVTAIGNQAFWGSSLTSVTLSDNLTSIGRYAFADTLLTSVDLPSSLLTVDEDAFSGARLTSVALPVSVVFGGYVFANNQITSVTIEDGREDVPFGMFYNNLLQTITIPDTVTTISSGAFSRNLISTLTIPSTVATIGDAAFSDNRLTDIVFPPTVTSAGEFIFSDNLLTSVTLPEGWTTIPGYTFLRNRLTNVAIPASVTTIGESAFDTNLITTITIPPSVTNIGGWAFNENQLSEVSIPATVATVGEAAFDYNHLNWIDVEGASTTMNIDYSTEYGTRTWVGFFIDGQWAGRVTDIPGAGRYWSGWDPAIVTLDGNGGTADATELQVPWDTATGVEPTASRPGYTLAGWSETADGSSGLFDWTEAMHLDVSFYAQWTPLIVTTTLDPNGGILNGPATVDAPVGGTFPAVTTPPTRAGYTFLGWAATADGSGGLVNVDQAATENLTLFAQWKLPAVVVIAPVADAGNGPQAAASPDLAYTGFRGFATLIAGAVLALSGASVLAARSWFPRRRRHALESNR